MKTAMASDATPARAETRRITLRTRGQAHGPITRLMSPSDELSEQLKPFVFLDHIDVGSPPSFGFHPHSGIATLTLLLEGGFSYEDSTGAFGTMTGGSVEWMCAGGGVWHRGSGIGQRIKGYQLWLALPPELENGPTSSRYLGADAFHSAGPARVILGELDGLRSPIEAPSPINYLDVDLRAGERWRYQPPAHHELAWIAVHRGRVHVGEAIRAGEMVVFEDGPAAIDFIAASDEHGIDADNAGASFVLGSARRHPHRLALGNYSVHTTPAALARGEDGIRRVAEAMRVDARKAHRTL